MVQGQPSLSQETGAGLMVVNLLTYDSTFFYLGLPLLDGVSLEDVM